MEAIAGTGLITPEPLWHLLLSDPLEIAAASQYWAVLTAEMRDRQILAPANGHALQRLVITYLLHDRCARQVAENGAVIRPQTKRGIARLDPAFTAMGELAADALQLESDLGLTPRRRGSAAKVERRRYALRPADQYLRPLDAWRPPPPRGPNMPDKLG